MLIHLMTYYYSDAALSTWKRAKESILLGINLASTTALNNKNLNRYGLFVPKMAGISTRR